MKLRLTPKRLAWLFTAVAAGLAGLPVIIPGRTVYSPEVAVLAATLIAIIWYTYYAHVAVHPPRESWADVRARLLPGQPPEVQIWVRNPHRWPLRVRLWAHVWIERMHFETERTSFHRGQEVMNLAPFEGHKSTIRLNAPGRGTFRNVYVAARATWEDGEGAGETGWKHWHLRADTGFRSLVLFQSEVERMFAELPEYRTVVGSEPRGERTQLATPPEPPSPPS